MTPDHPRPRLTDADFRACLPPFAVGPGCAIAVVQGGEVTDSFCTGFASVEHGAPITPDTVFRVASVTKQFLCAAVLTLVDAGKLALDDPLGRHLPFLQGVPARVTIAQAMSNTSGIRDHLELWYIAGGGLSVPHRLRDSLALCARQQETNFVPGSDYLYSNANFLLLSQIVTQAAGQPAEDYIEAGFFRPLGMTNTKLRAGHHDVIPGLATGYVERDGAISRGSMTTELSGEGSAHSTLNDLVTWSRYYRTDPESLIARMRVPAAYGGGQGGFYGFGLMAEAWRGQSTVSHSGLWPGYRTEVVWFDDQDLVLITLANVSAIDTRAVNRRLAERLLGDQLAPVPEHTLDPDLWRTGCDMGPFVNPETFFMVEMAVDKDKPHLVIYGGQTPLLPLGPDRAALDIGATEVVWFDFAEVAAGRLRMQMRSGESITLQALSTLPDVGPRAMLVGTWWSDETQSTLTITQTETGFTVETPAFRGHDFVARPLDAGALVIEDFTGPWPRRFLLIPDAANGALVVVGPRVTRLAFRRIG